MNIPYETFYKSEGTYVDAIASATTKVRDSDRAGASYNGSGNATDTENVTVKSKGAQFPVKVNDASLLDTNKEVTDSTSYTTVAVLHGTATPKTYKGKAALIQADDYAYYKLNDAPTNYVELTADGFSAVQGDVTSVTGSSDNITYGGRHRTYEITLPDGVTGQIAAAKVVTDKLTFGLKTTDEIFNKDREIGWDPEGNLADTNGATLKSVTVYTDSGVYNVSYDVKLKTKSDATVSSTIKGNVASVAGLPSDIQNAKATVSTSTTNQNGRETLTAVEGLKDLTVAGGQFDIPEGTTFTEGTTYKVTIASDNYFDLTGNVTFSNSTDTYVMMNIPYADFEKLMDGDNASVVDAVSGATAKVRNSGVAGLTYNNVGSTADAAKTANDTAKGVRFPVKVSDSTVLSDSKYTKLTNASSYQATYSGRGQTTSATLYGKDALIAAGNYAYVVLADTPDVYLELTNDGLAKGNLTETSVDGSSTSITYGGHHQTYELSIQNYISGTVAAVKIVTDKLSFWARPTDQIWRSIEIGWTPEGNLAVTNGATLQSYTVYTDKGVYNVSVNQKLKSVSDAEISATLSNSVGRVNDLPADIKNAKVTVSFTEGSGRDAKTTKLIEGASLSNGRFTIPSGTLTAGTEYDVTVSSDNYLDLTTAAVYQRSSSSHSSSGTNNKPKDDDNKPDQPDQPAKVEFEDISDSYAKTAIEWAVEKDIVSGTSATTFSPKRNVSRAEFVTFLWKLAGKEEVSTETSFTDLPSNETFRKAIAWAVENGITAGTSDTTFSPDDTVTREQAAQFLYKYFKGSASDADSEFPDVQSGKWYTSAINWGHDSGIIAGYTNGDFGFGDDTTREAAITFIYKAATK